MSVDHQESSMRQDKRAPITRKWRLGGPMAAAQRKEAKSLFLEVLKKYPNVSAACEHACISRSTAYQWREIDESFANDWEDAIDYTKDVARSSIYLRGIIGWDEPIVAQGKVAVDEFGDRLLIHKWSDSLASLYAKSNLPEYKEKQQIEHTGKDGAPIEVVNVTKETLKQKLDAIKASMGVKVDEV